MKKIVEMKTAIVISILFLFMALFTHNQVSLVNVSELPASPVDPKVFQSSYGNAPQQFGELRLPRSNGPYPVVVLLHGGCWLNAYDLYLMDPMATALTQSGYATWNLEYRRIGDEGGGWPGTFLDVAAGLNHLRELSSAHNLDLSHLVVAGHSSGGHLALWLAGQHQLPGSSEIHTREVLPISGVVSLAGITDPNSYLVREGRGCGTAVSSLLAGLPENIPERYRQASPLALSPIGVDQVLIAGREDRIVPILHVEPYFKKARRDGEIIELIVVPAVGHFELTAPGSAAWKEVLKAIEMLASKKAGGAK
jgi:acetyl esterase/lipase